MENYESAKTPLPHQRPYPAGWSGQFPLALSDSRESRNCFWLWNSRWESISHYSWKFQGFNANRPGLSLPLYVSLAPCKSSPCAIRRWFFTVRTFSCLMVDYLTDNKNLPTHWTHKSSVIPFPIFVWLEPIGIKVFRVHKSVSCSSYLYCSKNLSNRSVDKWNTFWTLHRFWRRWSPEVFPIYPPLKIS